MLLRLQFSEDSLDMCGSLADQRSGWENRVYEFMNGYFVAVMMECIFVLGYGIYL